MSEALEQRLAQLEGEVAQLRAAAGPGPTRLSVGPLHGRPDIERLLRTRLGWLALALAQHGIWTARSGWRRIRFKLRPKPPAAAAPMPVLVATDNNTSTPETDREPEPAPALAVATPAPEPEAPAPLPELTSVPFDPAILRNRPKLLIDITLTAMLPYKSGGIGRVARGLAAAGVKTGLGLPVHIVADEIRSYYQHPALPDPIQPQTGDIYLLVDVFWFYMPVYRAMAQRIRAAGGRVALINHDMGPLRFPKLFREDMPPLFKTGFLEMLQLSDFCICVSDHVEQDTRDFLRSIGFPGLPSLRFGHFLLGVDRAPRGDARLRPSLVAPFDGDRTFVSVGTLEPRKGYDVTLDACELAWLSGARFNLVILGRYGWSAETLEARILAHPELNRRLFWFADASDAELAYGYTHCRSLIQSSFDEGFCLPVSEASLFGAAIISSDLPVIREVAGAAVSYYRVGSPEDLALRINEALAARPMPSTFRVRSWTESIRELATCFADPDATLLADEPCSGIPPITTGPIHVACCFDDGMALPAAVLAASVAAATTDASVVFHMICAPGLATDLAPLQRQLESARFRVVRHTAPADTSTLYRYGPYSHAVYFRLMIPDLIDADRVIYLDSDTMVRRSLSFLWGLDLEGHPIAATVDYLTLSHRNGTGIPVDHAGRSIQVGDYCRDVLGLDLEATPYFNSGVMIMDLKAWRRTGLAAQIRAGSDSVRQLTFVDQDAANAVLQGDFLVLDQRWNAFVLLEHVSRAVPERTGRWLPGTDGSQAWNEELQAAIQAWADPWIVHFASRSKPWRADDVRTDFDEEFWEHAFQTPFGPALRELHAQVVSG